LRKRDICVAIQNLFESEAFDDAKELAEWVQENVVLGVMCEQGDVDRFWRQVYSAWLRAPAKIVDPVLQRVVAEVAASPFGDDCGQIGTHLQGPLKKPDRVAAKMSDYTQKTSELYPDAVEGAEAGGVVDVARCTIEVESPQHAKAAMDTLLAKTLEADGFQVVRAKNMFFIDAAMPYRDLKCTAAIRACMKDGSSVVHLGEVQIILTPYMKAKEDLHILYEVGRGDLDLISETIG